VAPVTAKVSRGRDTNIYIQVGTSFLWAYKVTQLVGDISYKL
jgi:hypothetical protein